MSGVFFTTSLSALPSSVLFVWAYLLQFKFRNPCNPTEGSTCWTNDKHMRLASLYMCVCVLVLCVLIIRLFGTIVRFAAKVRQRRWKAPERRVPFGYDLIVCRTVYLGTLK